MQKYRILVKKLSIVGVFLTIFCCHSFAQEVQVGGNIGFDVTNDVLMIDIAPMIGNSPFTNARVSISPFFSHIRSLTRSGTSISRTGLRAAAQYTIISGLFVHAEYEFAFVYANKEYQGVFHSLPLGAGFEYAISPNTVAYAALLYDVLFKESNYNRQTPFQYRVGVRYTL
ncbi:MAG: hypothetical protein FWC39_01570 [Bacteroidetes bacterium]|nr:hypothetical protein [Bacteroidota bacterium]